jgi:hypothetical protein
MGPGKQPCSLEGVKESPVICRAAILHAKAMRNWSSATLVKFASKSTARPYFSVLLSCSLSVGFKRLGQAARGGQLEVHGDEQRQIARLEKTVKVALRKHIAAHHHGF